MPPTPISPFDAWSRARQDVTQRLTTALVLWVFTAGPLAVSFLFTADDVESGRFVPSPPCMTKLVLGIECPTCGMTRAFMALSHGEVARAIDYNMLSLVVYPAFWVVALVATFAAARALSNRVRLGRRLVS